MELFMKEIEDERYKQLMEETTSQINDICVYGQYLLDLINTSENNKYSDTIILFLFRELLETADGIMSLLKGSSINISTILFRNMFELSLSINYIFLDEDMIEKRALSYEVNSIHERIAMYEKLNTENEEHENFRRIIGEDIINTFDSERLNSATENLRSMFEKYPEYSVVDEDRTRKKDEINLRRRQRGFSDLDPKWYQIYSEASNIRRLSKLLDMERYYLILYNQWSNKVHGGAAMSGFRIVDNEPVILNPKVPESSKDIPEKLELLQTFMSDCYRHICKYFLTDDDCQNMGIWHFSMREKESEIREHWSKIEFKYEN
ncbi:DUF5677 domain-containing protein [Clostridioides sp. GD02377]|uniref:DUF5677 domain-containing protein n=1 Tax=unclassified Clostridioides TaxID=2635829 RepID=UPI0038A13EC1